MGNTRNTHDVNARIGDVFIRCAMCSRDVAAARREGPLYSRTADCGMNSVCCDLLCAFATCNVTQHSQLPPLLLLLCLLPLSLSLSTADGVSFQHQPRYVMLKIVLRAARYVTRVTTNKNLTRAKALLLLLLLGRAAAALSGSARRAQNT